MVVRRTTSVADPRQADDSLKMTSVRRDQNGEQKQLTHAKEHPRIMQHEIKL